MYINTFKYKPEDVSCVLCTEYVKKLGCTALSCPCLAERMEAGTVGYAEAVAELFPYRPRLTARIMRLAERFPGTMWQDDAHRKRTGLDERGCVIRAINTDDLDITATGVGASGSSAAGHSVIATDDAGDIGVCLKDCFGLFITLGLIPVGGLLCNHLQVGILIDHSVEVVRTDMAVRVGLQTKQLGILAFVTHSLDPCLSDRSSALRVVRNDLRNSQPGNIDFTVDQEAGDTGVVSLLDGFDGSVGTSVVQNNECGLVGDRGFDRLKLLGCIVIMGNFLYLIALGHCVHARPL